MAAATQVPPTQIHQPRSGLAPAPNVPNPRNDGRKKSNPVWEFFTDLRGHGLAGVRCRFCHWVTNDRSPTTMKFHLKRKHDTGPGGLWAICEEKINSQAPANYGPRMKKISEDNGNGANMFLKVLNQQSLCQPFSPFSMNSSDTKTEVSSQDDFINSLIQQATNMSNLASIWNNLPKNESSSSSQENDATICLTNSIFLDKLNENLKEEDGSSSSVSGVVPTPSNDFHLSDGSSIAALLQIASDSDLTFTFNSRRSGEYCFEANKKNGRMVVFCDLGNEIRVAHVSGGDEIFVETWRKSDWAPFSWAGRGGCLHFLKQ
ncbi:hypothetical protein WR25_11406 isoform A [Diploscapter pachys]|uniref:BED-type domain-containing protein n=1 Tax=Diploscapter pachys TaxID=2018661 RepID=A0A2A2JRT8_9BILA|nr:hypothetical protein WR25_11406 isoform A [Diploscapter pachys]